MATIRFKPYYIKDIISPRVIDTGLYTGLFKTRTTRTKPKKCGEYEIICGVPPRPLYNQVKTGVFIKINEVQLKSIQNYTPTEMIGDVGYYDVNKFLETLNGLNKARTKTKITGECVEALHSFKFLNCTSDIDKILKDIQEIQDNWKRK